MSTVNAYAYLLEKISELPGTPPPGSILGGVYPEIRGLDGGDDHKEHLKRSAQLALNSAQKFEEHRRNERLRQARLSFNAALSLLVFGILIVLGGVLMLFQNHVTSGLLSSGAGVVSNMVSAVLFKFNRDANDRLDKIKVNLAKIETLGTAIAAIEKVDAGVRLVK
jgi:TRADD-N domain-containing protein